jgi:hypothetical protein
LVMLSLNSPLLVAVRNSLIAHNVFLKADLFAHRFHACVPPILYYAASMPNCLRTSARLIKLRLAKLLRREIFRAPTE